MKTSLFASGFLLFGLLLGNAALAVQRTPDYLCNAKHMNIKYLQMIRWNPHEFPLRVYLPPPQYQAGMPLSGAQYQGVIKRAFFKFTRVLPAFQFTFVDDPKKAAIQVKWELTHSNKFALGEAFPAMPTNLRRDAKHVDHKASILLSPQTPPGLALNENYRFFSAGMLEHVAMHEIGHVMGLFMHSADPADLMFPYNNRLNDRPAQLTARDINTLKRLYRLPKVIKRSPCS